MMIRSLMAAGLSLLLLAGTAVAADPPATVIMKSKSEKQGDVTFKHATHKDKACTTCHESDKGGKLELDEKKGHAMCQKCHMDTAKADATKKPLAACTNCHEKKKK